MSNLVNYKSFGFSKFIPRISADNFKALASASENAEEAVNIWNEVCFITLGNLFWRDADALLCYQLANDIYTLEPEASLLIGKPSVSVSTTFPKHCVNVRMAGWSYK